jgi:hypothetical protein
MKWINGFKSAGHQFVTDEPGRRFLNFYDRVQHIGSRAVVMIVGLGGGILLMVVGFFLGLVPGVPGFVLGILGLALIASQFPPLARGCDATELSCRRWLRKLRGEKMRRTEEQKTAVPATKTAKISSVRPASQAASSGRV